MTEDLVGSYSLEPDLNYYIYKGLGNNTLNLSLTAKFAQRQSSGKMYSQLALLHSDWLDFESIFY